MKSSTEEEYLHEVLAAAERSAAASRSFKSKLMHRQGDLSTPDLSGHTSPLSTTPTLLMRSGNLSDAMRLSPDTRPKVRTRMPNSDKKSTTEKRVFLKSRLEEDILNTVVNHKPKAAAKPTFVAKHAEPRSSPRIENEKILMLSQKLTESREHYKALEKKYRELKLRRLGLDMNPRAEGLLDRPSTTDLYAELRASPRSIDHSENSAIRELLGVILAEVRDVKVRVTRLEAKFMSD